MLSTELQDIIHSLLIDEDNKAITSIKTFEHEGVMSTNAGLVIKLNDGTEFQLTIIQSR